ncbi:hypothetical protein [Phenylobacterium sp.]|uniref:hypothetical protein n=1 Tax=Phenylobacterium sp. TaxID=1871053 RepID=UPI00301C7F7B
MSESAPPPPADAEARIPLFADPLAGWVNHDILLDKDARRRLGAAHPQALRVLDWPELRALFNKHEAPANHHARRDRRLALASVLVGVAALVTAAFAPLSDVGAGTAWPVVPGALAVLLALAAGVLAIGQVLAARSNAGWLGSRYWTERARGLYFQVLVNNLDLAARAMTDDAALGAWKRTRAQALDALPPAGDLAGRVRDMTRDVADDEVWIVPAWRAAPPAPEPSPHLDLLLSCLRAQRMDVQIDYSRRKLGDSLATPRRQADAARRAAGALTVAAVTAAGLAGLLLTVGFTPHALGVRAVVAVAAAAAALALGLRAVNDSLFPASDLVRYAWYNAAAVQARAQFDSGDLEARIDALRAMEGHAYRDLRGFIASHTRPR